MKRREPKKPARKKREQERSTTGSRSRVRISPPPPPLPLLMAPPPFITAGVLVDASPVDERGVGLAEDDDENEARRESELGAGGSSLL